MDQKTIYIQSTLNFLRITFLYKKYFLKGDGKLYKAQVIRPLPKKGFMGRRTTEKGLEEDFDWLTKPVHDFIFLPLDPSINSYYLFYQKYLPNEKPSNFKQKPNWGCKILNVNQIYMENIGFENLKEISNAKTNLIIKKLIQEQSH